jgi:endonuclease V-like protein UPF0215 family
MKHLETCNKILNNQQVTENELTGLVAEVCVEQKREDAIQYIPIFLQLLAVGQFNIIDVIKQHAAYNNKQFITLLHKGNAIKHWIK